nr:PREDICTED: mitotic-spindle organizing protein 1-like [Megachile rotundata]
MFKYINCDVCSDLRFEYVDLMLNEICNSCLFTIKPSSNFNAKLSHTGEKERNRGSMPEPVHHQINAARKTFQTLYQISKLLNTNLDPTTLSICIRLCENGVNPYALATVVKELQREVKAMDNANQLESPTSKSNLKK